ncbi:VOC family protein [Aliifodinibius sp. S!AR15-10]|uniref:VOC family protein n=1 Tax=Aliifodinibius sp. S!AR15-10 TaxID=2950437 RepID=UPI00285E4B08|nr:VOC family protein [Aliifodinibius sp. S!AR15-10]MDR8393901.1 VOC family protein [Aliifodinibius sp. S!AR15-10]
MKISLTSIHVDDPIEAFKFYTEILGFKEQVFMPEASLAIVVSPEEPEGTGLLLEPSDNPVAQQYKEGLYEQGLPAIVFGVEDIEAEYERLKNAGVAFTKEPTKTDWGYEAIFDDSCGNYIQMAQT